MRVRARTTLALVVICLLALSSPTAAAADPADALGPPSDEQEVERGPEDGVDAAVALEEDETSDRPEPTTGAPDDRTASPPDLALTVHKRNDADGDGSFSDREEVRGAGAAVTFRIGVRNTSQVALTIVSASDSMGDTELDLLHDGPCPQLATTLQPGGHVACSFTLDRYLRTYDEPPYRSLTNVVRIVATDGSNQVEVEDTSTVVNPNAGRLSAEVSKTTDADGDGTFSTAELAATPGQAVAFRVTVYNTSPGTAMITSLTDSWEGLATPIDLLDLCPALSQVRLRGIGGGGDHDDGHRDDHDDGGCGGHAVSTDASTRGGAAPGGSSHDGAEGGCGGGGRSSSVTCTFTLEGYAPPAGTTRTNTISVTLTKPHDRSITTTVSSTASVSTATAPITDVPGDGDVELPGDADGRLPSPDGAPSHQPTTEVLAEVVAGPTGPTATTAVVTASTFHRAQLPITGAALPALVLAALAGLVVGTALVRSARAAGLRARGAPTLVLPRRSPSARGEGGG